MVSGVAVVAAGTSDLPIAREAVLTATLMGCDVIEINDVGVAGLHRLSHRMDDLVNARVIVVVAGMEGRCPASSGASFGRRLSPCRHRSATERVLAALPRYWRC